MRPTASRTGSTCNAPGAPFRAKRGRRPVVREARPDREAGPVLRAIACVAKGVAGSLSFPSVERHPTVLVRLEDEFG